MKLVLMVTTEKKNHSCIETNTACTLLTLWAGRVYKKKKKLTDNLKSGFLVTHAHTSMEEVFI